MRTPRRGRADGKLYARAAPEKVEITEEYSVEQEISANQSKSASPGSGRIEITVPFDGKECFTRQAVDDVKWGTGGARSWGGGPGAAVIGHLLLADHTRTDLRSDMRRQYGTAGVIPIEVPVPASADDLDQLADDRHECLIEYDYRVPDGPEVIPIWFEVALFDPDTMALVVKAADVIDQMGELDLARLIGQLRRDAGFTSELEMSIRVCVAIPVKDITQAVYYDYAPAAPQIKLVSVDWPGITSLTTTKLERDATQRDRELLGKDDLRIVSHPVRYNPVRGRLEWEDFPMGAFSVPDGSPDKRVFTSMEMRLKIGHPGELFTTPEGFAEQKLRMRAEVEIPEYLLSGLDARLFSATGDRVRGPEPGDSGDWQRPWERKPREAKLTTRLSVDTEFYVRDAFANREFKPYQQIVFDDVIPDDMRIMDILTVLRNSKFRTESAEDPGNQSHPDEPKWLISAVRQQGPDTLGLLIAVDGKKYEIDRMQIMGDPRIRQSRSTESGQLRLSVLGTLPREHAELASEMSRLQQALRARFRPQRSTRR